MLLMVSTYRHFNLFSSKSASMFVNYAKTTNCHFTLETHHVYFLNKLCERDSCLMWSGQSSSFTQNQQTELDIFLWLLTVTTVYQKTYCSLQTHYSDSRGVEAKLVASFLTTTTSRRFPFIHRPYYWNKIKNSPYWHKISTL